MKIRPYLYGNQFFLLLLTLISTFMSCTRASEENPVIPPTTNPLSSHVVGYGVINVSYTHVVDQPSANAVSLGYLRQGSVVRIIERRSLTDALGISELWVFVDGNYRGWLQETVVNIFSNEAQAKTAGESMTK
jgi:hypothetical protein